MEFRRTIYKDLLNWKNSNSGKVLQLEGARQVGKTFILRKFAKENYKQEIYINMAQYSGREFETLVDSKDAHLIFDKYTNGEFRDTRDTIVIIDEIQESSKIYSMIRQFAREFKCDFVVTGSYLGRLLDKEFFLAAGDTDKLTMYTLSFEEFLDACGMLELYNSLDLVGSSNHEDYDKIKKYYEVYIAIGGYPSVVTKYLENKPPEIIIREIESILNVFLTESIRYLESFDDAAVLKGVLQSISELMTTEKYGNSNLIEELQKKLYQKEDNRITKKTVQHVVSWLYNSGIIGYCGAINNGDRVSLLINRRFYFIDNGMACYFLRLGNAPMSDVHGTLSENFVYRCLVHQISNIKIRGSSPNFCLYQGGELDFYEVSTYDDKVYGLEVKAERGIGKTANKLLEDGKIDYLYLLKGDTYGGKFDDHKYTIPIYLCQRLEFNLGEKRCYMNLF